MIADSHSEADVPAKLAILFADISGSTHLYEILGDVEARRATSACLDILANIVVRNKGLVVKTIGDEIMARFDSPVRAVLAANEMQIGVREGNESGELPTGDMHIKIGFHYANAYLEAGELHGEAPIIASQVIGMAKADQILSTREVMDAVPPELRAGSRAVDRFPLDGRTEDTEVFELIWDISGATQIAGVVATAKRTTHSQLRLDLSGRVVTMNAHRPEVSMGRTDGNDIIAVSDLTSRNHARIEYRRGRFVLHDMSANGTVVVRADGQQFFLRRDEHTLDASGRICLGGQPGENPQAELTYECQS